MDLAIQPETSLLSSKRTHSPPVNPLVDRNPKKSTPSSLGHSEDTAPTSHQGVGLVRAMSSTAQDSADQVKRLLELPFDQAALYSSLCSQYSKSEYNVTKLRPSPDITTFPLPLASLLLVPEQQKVIPEPTKSIWEKFKSGTRSVPSLSRPSTPPSKAITSAGVVTSLSPTMVNFTINSNIFNSPSGNLQSALSDASRENMDLVRKPLLSSPSAHSKNGQSSFKEGKRVPIYNDDDLVGTIVGGQLMTRYMTVINGNIAVKTSLSHPMNISPIIPPDYLPVITADYLHQSSTLDPSVSISDPWLIKPGSFNIYDYIIQPSPAEPVPKSTHQFGNFFLSSCPGKKVRLIGPPAARGSRSAISRDLTSDFTRAKEFGVAVLVCCLDDEELKFLGAPFEEYSAAAKKLGLEIIRIPISEGAAPQSPELLDELLSRVIIDFILKGKSVLCSCRGGVGRAGSIALCFLLKFGLVGDVLSTSTVEVVKRSIAVIRQRRSTKAIETPQQVQFIFDYVDYLKTAQSLEPIRLIS